MAAFHPRVEDLPDEFPVFPLPGALLLPRGKLPLRIFEPRYKAMTEDALGLGRMFGMIQPDPTVHESELGPGLYRIRLDHAEHATQAQSVFRHRLIARLENAQRQLAARQQQRARQRKYRKLVRQVLHPRVEGGHLAEQYRGQLAPRRRGGGIVEAPGLEELQQLEPGGILVPGAVAADDVEQRIRCLLTLSNRVQRGGEVVARLQIARFGSHARLEAM